MILKCLFTSLFTGKQASAKASEPASRQTSCLEQDPILTDNCKTPFNITVNFKWNEQFDSKHFISKHVDKQVHDATLISLKMACYHDF